MPFASPSDLSAISWRDFRGASVAALATFLPCYLFTLLPAPYFKKISKNRLVKAFVDGITAGALAGAILAIASRNISDPTALLAIAVLLTLSYFKKIHEPLLILFAALVGILLRLHLS